MCTYQQSKRCYKTMCTLYIQCTNKVKDVIKQCVHTNTVKDVIKQCVHTMYQQSKRCYKTMCTYNVPTK